MGDEPACSDALRGEAVTLKAECRDEDEKECDGEGEDSKGDGVVDPPGQEEQARNGKAQ